MVAYYESINQSLKGNKAMNTTKKNYNSYATAFIKDGMEPLSFSEWLRVQKNAHKTELATPYGN